MTRRQLLASAVLTCGAITSRSVPLYNEQTPPVSVVRNRPTVESAQDCCAWVCWLGHSTVLINVGGTWILTDPVLFPTYGLSFMGLTLGPRRFTPPALRIEELPKPDIVLLSHAHLDHMDRATLSALCERWPNQLQLITATNTLDVVEDLAWHTKQEMDWNETGTVCGVTITALQVAHNGWRIPGEPCRAAGQKRTGRSFNGYLLERNGVQVVFGGDTAYTQTFANLKKGVDLAIMPIGAYHGYQDMHCTPEEAVAMCQMMGARSIMPVHFGTFRQSEEPPAEPPHRLMKAIQRTNVLVVGMGLGGSFSIT